MRLAFLVRTAKSGDGAGSSAHAATSVARARILNRVVVFTLRGLLISFDVFTGYSCRGASAGLLDAGPGKVVMRPVNHTATLIGTEFAVG
jgi:hypothetical protein